MGKSGGHVLGNQRAEYGQQIVHALSAQLVLEFGAGYSKRKLFNMIGPGPSCSAFPRSLLLSAVPSFPPQCVSVILWYYRWYKSDGYREDRHFDSVRACG